MTDATLPSESRSHPQVINFGVKEAIFIPKENLDTDRDVIVLRVPIAGRDAVVRLDVQSYVSQLDGTDLFSTLVDPDIKLPRHMTEDYPKGK